MLSSLAVVLEQPERIALTRLPLDPPAAGDVVVETLWSGVSAGTERLLFTGRMPPFPGMGYPLVPGYECVGKVVEAGPEAGIAVGAQVFVPGARCFGPVRGLHGGSASHLVVPASRVAPVPASLGEKAVLLALAATAFHALAGSAASDGVLIVGHGVLGRLLARLARALGRPSGRVGEEPRPVRRRGWLRRDHAGRGQPPRLPDDFRRQRRSRASSMRSCSGSRAGGEIVLAGFYDRLSFSFPPAFMREARIRIAAQWREGDLAETVRLVEAGGLSLDGLVTHRRAATDAASAYPIAFDDPSCLKMVLDWRSLV